MGTRGSCPRSKVARGEAEYSPSPNDEIKNKSSTFTSPHALMMSTGATLLYLSHSMFQNCLIPLNIEIQAAFEYDNFHYMNICMYHKKAYTSHVNGFREKHQHS
jgi:hypothetical protein